MRMKVVMNMQVVSNGNNNGCRGRACPSRSMANVNGKFVGADPRVCPNIGKEKRRNGKIWKEIKDDYIGF